MFNPQVEEGLRGYSDTEVFERLTQVKAGLSAAVSKDPRDRGVRATGDGRPLIGENRPDAKLHAETLPRNMWDAPADPICAGIEALVAVHRLREVSCLYGFTRFEPAPLADDGLEDIGLAI